MIYFIIIVVLLLGWLAYFLNHPQFGSRKYTGERLKRIQQSPQYKAGSFQNKSHTPSFTNGYTFGKVLYNFLFVKYPRTRPEIKIPSVKTNLHQLDKRTDLIVWFGHSSYFIQLNGLRFLVDPVFSGNASPLRGSNRSFAGSDIYTVNDIPAIDYLLITHDHYDHLDYTSIRDLKPKVANVITGLGVGNHFEKWGYDSKIVQELDWEEHVVINNTTEIWAMPARHFSGRGFSRNKSLWLSFVLESAAGKLYIGGDSGYDTHFKEIGEQYGPFDIALLENGQYNKAWQSIHMFPDEAFQAAKDLRAKRFIAGHSGKFKMGMHEWDEPLKQVYALSKDSDLKLLTPRIGEPVYINKHDQTFTNWWENTEGL